jgi:hypothetical protein
MRTRCRGAASPALVLVLALVLGGCGTRSPDLFEVRRSGEDPNANVTLLVNDGGSVTCNGAEHGLDTERLLRARQVARDLEPQAELLVDLPPGPDAQLSYRVRMEAGTIAFADTSRAIPRSFQALAAFTSDVTERVCGIER